MVERDRRTDDRNFSSFCNRNAENDLVTLTKFANSVVGWRCFGF